MIQSTMAGEKIIAANALKLMADASGKRVTLSWKDNQMFADPGDEVQDILRRHVDAPEMPPVDDIQLQSGRVWIGKPDPGYRGEMKRVVPFQEEV